MNWYLSALKRYVDFGGRARRKEFWYFILFNLVIVLLLTVVDMLMGTYNQKGQLGLLSGLYSLFVLLPIIAVTVRRLYDTDRSGWWGLIVLVPILGAIVLFVFMLFDGTEGANRFGMSPKNSAEVNPFP